MEDTEYTLLTIFGVLAFVGFWVWFLYSIFHFLIERYEKIPLKYASTKKVESNKIEKETNKSMNKINNNWKDYVGYFMAGIVIISAIVSLIYYNFFYKPAPYKFLTPKERQEMEQKLINRYGSLDNIPENINIRDCLDFGEGKGCW